jgi:S-formylglutathione hydrolase FrmB
MILTGNVHSETLRRDTALSVCFSPAFDQRRPYKVAYLFHGLHGDDRTWLNNSLLAVYARQEGRNMAFVMPDTARGFYANSLNGYRYLDYVADELPEIVERFFGLKPGREHTAVIGGSMGGYGALLCALSRPKQYSYCAAFAASTLFMGNVLDFIRTEDGYWRQETPENQAITRDLQGIFGENLELRPEYELLDLVKALKPAEMPRIYHCCGSEDSMLGDNEAFAGEMRQTACDYFYEQLPGAHDWIFFNEALRRSIERW